MTFKRQVDRLPIIPADAKEHNVTGYLVMTFTGCKGKSPTEMSVKDGEFFAPKYVIRTAGATGEAPMTINTVAQLPVVTPAP